MVDRVLGVGILETVPGPDDRFAVRAPVRQGQGVQESVLVARPGFERKPAGRAGHQGGIVAEVPALHRAADTQFAHLAVLVIKDAWHRHMGHGGDFVRAADLELGKHAGAVPTGIFRTTAVERAGPGVGQPVIVGAPGAAQLLGQAGRFEVMLQDHRVRHVPGRLDSAFIAPEQVLGIRPGDKLGVRIGIVHAPLKAVQHVR